MGAIELAEEYRQRGVEASHLLCSDMLDLPTFAGLLRDRLSTTEISLYFHENQFAYPWSEREKYRVAHRRYLGQMNVKSALIADRCFFNSQFNLDTFLDGTREMIREAPEAFSSEIASAIQEKSSVLPLGIDCREAVGRERNEERIILWNHRWEEDKDPNTFFHILFELANEGVPFGLVVLGQPQDVVLPIFEEAKSKLAPRIKHFGYIETKDEYHSLVSECDVLPVTSKHDFFGISVLEAVAAGVVPLLPKSLVYPEHFSPDEFLDFYYSSKAELKDKLRVLLTDENKVDVEPIREVARGYSWERVIPKYVELFGA